MNNTQDFIDSIMDFCEGILPEIVAEFERKRFENQGEFNGHEKWDNNNPEVIKDKGRNEPLIDSGRLKREITDPYNWGVAIISKKDKMSLTLSIPDTESFTDQKYNKLDEGFVTGEYVSPRGNVVFKNRRNVTVPARPFRDLTAQDINWIKNRLIEEIKKEYE